MIASPSQGAHRSYPDQEAEKDKLRFQVELEFVKEEHEENLKKDHCKWCEQRIPFSDMSCSVRFGTTWTIHQIE